MLETSDLSVDRISALVGFAAPTTFRERFRAAVGVSPAHYRRSFTIGPRPGGAVDDEHPVAAPQEIPDESSVQAVD